jgi:hypothetical protein
MQHGKGPLAYDDGMSLEQMVSGALCAGGAQMPESGLDLHEFHSVVNGESAQMQSEHEPNQKCPS